MGYQTAFLMIEGVSAAEAMDVFDSRFDAADLFASPGEGISFEEAASSFLHPNLALGETGGWAVFWDPSGGLVGSGFPAAASKERRVFTGLLAGADSRYECVWLVGGTEKPALGQDEDSLFAAMARLTGVSFADLMGAAYRRLEFLG